ncbi:MAG: UDP-N-acetylmuramate--L-alanine ligase, partial [Bacteroidales bacterium]|nr:UDP-N-acetylmuramate--L-alanine ligase [Bacteroidales bacterium]
MNYFFLGIGGIGMSAIARFFKQRGDTVSGYDRTPSQLTQQLESEGIPIQYTDDPSLLPSDIDCVVYTPAVPQQTALFQYFLSSRVPMEKRSQMLGELTRGKRAIAVAGTHGKTSTTSLIAHILHHTDMGCSAFLGGISKNFDSNLVVNNESPYVVVEADEYDRSFLQLHPYASVVTAIDDDHMDIYGTHQHLLEAFRQFASQTDPEGFIVMKQGVPLF